MEKKSSSFLFSKHTFSLDSFPKIVFLPAICWLYLLFSSQILIQFDAIGYEHLGILFYKKGWIEFFQTGPNREPFYPLLISFTMRMGDMIGISYHYVQKVFQISILLMTLWLTFKLLKKIKIHPSITAAAVLYLGLSPAILNSTFSLFSEIMTYPFILGIIVISAKSWQAILHDKRRDIIWLGICLACLFLILVLIKGIFEAILPLFLMSFLVLLFYCCCRKNRDQSFNCMLFIAAVFLCFQISLAAYKSLNYKFNHHFTVTNRGPWLLYGNAAKRIEPLSSRRLLAGITYIAGEGVCRQVFGDEECIYWSFRRADYHGYSKLQELSNTKIPESKIDGALVRLTLEKISENPFQYIFLLVLEGLKMLFWETTRLGNVAYPSWLETIFDNTIIKNILRLVMSILTIASWIYVINAVYQNKKALFSNQENNVGMLILFFSCVLVSAYVLSHSLFSIITRYALPLTPLYLIFIAFALQNFIFRKSIIKG